MISYVLGELAEKDRMRALEKCWNAAGTLLLIVEPGTPVGAAHLRQMREALKKNGGPCGRTLSRGRSVPFAGDGLVPFHLPGGADAAAQGAEGRRGPLRGREFADLAVSP